MKSLPVLELRDSEGQLKILGMGTTFGMVFASLLGALSITGEIRTGLIRPTLLMTPQRGRMLSPKFVAAAVGGLILGLCAEVVAIAVAGIGLGARGISLASGPGQFTQLCASRLVTHHPGTRRFAHRGVLNGMTANVFPDVRRSSSLPGVCG